MNSEINIKEMNAFDSFIRSKYGESVLWNNGEPTHPFYLDLWCSWQARVPEGYKLVPVEINDEIESAMFSSVARGEMPCDIYKAMLEAVEK